MDNRQTDFHELTQAFREGRLNRRSLIRRAAGLGVSLPMITAVVGAGIAPRLASAQETGGTLIFDLGSEPENLDPHQILAYTTARLTDQIFEPLVRFKSGTLELEPSLAESWTNSTDGKEWTFTLRQGVKFHDGSDFNANSVKFSFDRQFDETSPYYAQGTWASVADFPFIDNVRVDSDYVVTFVLTTPYNKFLNRMASSDAAQIVSPAAVEVTGEAFLEAPVGTGPYKFDRWEKGQQVVLVRNETYWDGTPGLDQIVFRAVTEEGARLAALLSGETHMALDILPETVESLSGSSEHTVASGPTGAIWFLAMNVEFEPFKDVRVRQAVNHAVNKTVIAEDVLSGTVQVAFGPLAPAFAEYNPNVETYYPYDPEKAKALLAEAGWDAEREIVFRCSIGGSGMLSPEEMATVIQDDLNAVGIKTKLEVTEFVAWMDGIRNPQNELTVMSWNVAPLEPDLVFNGILTKAALPPGFNTSYWVNDEVERLIKEGLETPDPAVATAAYQQAQDIVMQEAPIVPVCHRNQLYGVSNRVQNFVVQPSMQLDLTKVTVAG
jgi:peptide/nickel transport system substrate-binding protein